MAVKLAILGGICGVVMVAAWANGRLIQKGDRRMDDIDTRPVYKLNVERPFDFLEKNLPAALVSRPGSLRGDDAIDGIALARICRGETCAQIEIELLSGVKMDANDYYVRFCGAPATLDDAHSLALRLCDVAGIPNDRIVRWYDEKRYENVMTRTQLQTDGDGTNTHSVEVRSSLELQGDKLWRVIYTLYFAASGRREPLGSILPARSRVPLAGSIYRHADACRSPVTQH